MLCRRPDIRRFLALLCAALIHGNRSCLLYTSVRSVYTGYLGWFDGNPTKLGHMPVRDRAEKTVAMMGGAQAVLAEAKAALKRGDAQWSAELCDLLLDSGNGEAAGLKADALTEMCIRDSHSPDLRYRAGPG